MVPNPALQRLPTDATGTVTNGGTLLLPERGKNEAVVMRSILLWLIGIPIPIILLLALCTHHF